MSSEAFWTLVSEDGSEVDRRVLSDPEVYGEELRQIFASAWLYVGHESQVARPGEFAAASMGPDPVIMSRDADGQINVMLNRCSHRGSRVCRADRGDSASFRCPNHGWTFGLDGTLVSYPRADEGYRGSLRSSGRDLVKARVECRRGLVFATFAPAGPTLDEALGDILFYLDLFLDRDKSGTEVLGGVHRWTVPCNWKLLPENLSADLYHAPTAHASHMLVTGADTGDYLAEAFQVATGSGHSACVRRRSAEDVIRDTLAPAMTSGADRKALDDYLERSGREARSRLGPDRDRLHAFTGTLFPNFSFVPSLFTIRVARPLSPTSTEIWSWCLVPAGSPPGTKEAIRRIYSLSLGPAGLIEQEDCLNFAEMTAASTTVIDRRPLHVGMGLDDELLDLGLPGSAALAWTEHNMRAYWRAWRSSMGGS